MGHARTAKRAGETDAAAFSRILTDPANVELRKAYGATKGYPNLMDIEPVSTEAGSSEFEADSAEALKQLNEMVEEQRRRAPTLTTGQLFERVFQDPANAKLAARTYPRRDPNWHSAATVA